LTYSWVVHVCVVGTECSFCFHNFLCLHFHQYSALWLLQLHPILEVGKSQISCCALFQFYVICSGTLKFLIELRVNLLVCTAYVNKIFMGITLSLQLNLCGLYSSIYKHTSFHLLRSLISVIRVLNISCAHISLNLYLRVFQNVNVIVLLISNSNHSSLVYRKEIDVYILTFCVSSDPNILQYSLQEFLMDFLGGR
jgi:hypothetical protein